MNVREFYNSFASEYTASVMRCNPRYAEMIQSLLDSLPTSFEPARMADMGCGSGNLTAAMHRAYPAAAMAAMDISEDLIEICRRRVPKTVHVEQMDMRDFPRSPEGYDLVCSSLAIHHLADSDKQRLFERLARPSSMAGSLCSATASDPRPSTWRR